MTIFSILLSFSNDIYRSVVPGQKHSGPKYSVKIIKATMVKTGKRVTFEKGEVTYVEIQESSANIDYISREIQLLWGEEYHIVTPDGMEVKDCSGTRGKINDLIWHNLITSNNFFFCCSLIRPTPLFCHYVDMIGFTTFVLQIICTKF